MTTGEIAAAVIGPVSFGLFLFFFNRIQNRKPRFVHVPVEKIVECEKIVRVPVVVGSTDASTPPGLQEADVLMITGAIKINLDVTDCPRCGKDHDDVEFTRFCGRDGTLCHPIAGFTHFGECPDTSAPVLANVRVAGEGATADPATRQAADTKPACGGRCGN